jgi:hypothetical protein
MTLRPHLGCNLVSLLGMRLITLYWLAVVAVVLGLVVVQVLEDC